jgi:pyruvate/2-oxoglutarate dehydrogenase complex dihydrolipoamide dehydrogenase (E3) component
VTVDHEHVLDSDSILSLIYLPESLTVLGAGVIACEFASLFAALGVRVALVDRGRATAVVPRSRADDALRRGLRAHGRDLSSPAARRARCGTTAARRDDAARRTRARVGEVLCARWDASRASTDSVSKRRGSR